MSGIATAIVGTAVVGAWSANEVAKSTESAANKSLEAQGEYADENLAFQKELANQQREDFEPWRDSGQKALDQIWAGIESGEFETNAADIDVTADPGYQFRMQQGVDALDSSAAARGRLLSGSQQKALTEYGQNVGSQEYANAYAREEGSNLQKFNLLSSLSSQGQASAAGQAGASSQLASTGGNILSNLGYSAGQTENAIGAARAGAYSGMAQSVNQAGQNWLTYKAASTG